MTPSHFSYTAPPILKRKQCVRIFESLGRALILGLLFPGFRFYDMHLCYNSRDFWYLWKYEYPRTKVLTIWSVIEKLQWGKRRKRDVSWGPLITLFLNWESQALESQLIEMQSELGLQAVKFSFSCDHGVQLRSRDLLALSLDQSEWRKMGTFQSKIRPELQQL